MLNSCRTEYIYNQNFDAYIFTRFCYDRTFQEGDLHERLHVLAVGVHIMAERKSQQFG